MELFLSVRPCNQERKEISKAHGESVQKSGYVQEDQAAAARLFSQAVDELCVCERDLFVAFSLFSSLFSPDYCML